MEIPEGFKYATLSFPVHAAGIMESWLKSWLAGGFPPAGHFELYDDSGKLYFTVKKDGFLVSQAISRHSLEQARFPEHHIRSLAETLGNAQRCRGGEVPPKLANPPLDGFPYG